MSAQAAMAEAEHERLRDELLELKARADLTAAMGTLEARFSGIDVRFAKIDGQFAALSERLGAIERHTGGTKATVVLTGIATVTLVVAVMAYGQAWFGIGVSTRDVVHSAVAEYIQQHPAAAGK